MLGIKVARVLTSGAVGISPVGGSGRGLAGVASRARVALVDVMLHPCLRSSQQVSMYSNCSGAAPISGAASGVCGVRGDTASGGSDAEHGGRDDGVGRGWGDGSVVNGGEGWDEGGRTPRENDHGGDIGEDEVLEEWSPWILNGDEVSGPRVGAVQN